MSGTDNDDLQEAQGLSELDALKARADLLGVKYHSSIGLEKLRAKVNAAVTGEAPAEEDEPAETPKAALVPKETEHQKRQRLHQEAAKLVRIRVTCMNPAKKEWQGEIFTVGNSGVGTFRKYVPFNADDGWHVPHIMYQMLKERQCQIFVNKKDSRGNTSRQGKMIKEFAIEVLPPLTEAELKELALQQAASHAIDA